MESSTAELLNTTRAELAEAQRSRSELRDRLEKATSEAENLRKQIGGDGQRINRLESEVAQQKKRRKDVEEELRGKAKLLNVCLDFVFADRMVEKQLLTKILTSGISRRNCSFDPPGKHGREEGEETWRGERRSC